MKLYMSVVALIAMSSLGVSLAMGQTSSPSPSTTTPGKPSGAAPGTPGSAAPALAAPGTKSDAATKMAKPAGTKDAGHVKSIQEALKAKGHDPGPIDGIMGPKTMAALRAFQKEQNLQGAPTGPETLEKLGVKS